jgi:diaminopimelate decarboxylase
MIVTRVALMAASPDGLYARRAKGCQMADECVGYFESWKAVDGRLHIGNIDVSEVAKSFGTPLYLYDAEAIRLSHHALAKSFDGFTIAYSVKANPSVGICKLLQSLGCWAEVASGGEMLIARTAGFPEAHTMFAGPAKQESELRDACDKRISILKVESLRELELLASWMSRRTFCPSICIRVNTAESVSSAREIMAGGPSRFGLDEEVLPSVLRQYGSKLNIVGLHVYSGSQILNPQEIIGNFARIFDIFVACRQIVGEQFSTVVFGGGFGVPSGLSGLPLNLEEIGEGINRIIRTSGIGHRLHFILELGRFLVASSGIFITRVIDVKVSRGSNFVLTDGGINNYLRPALKKLTHSVDLIERLNEAKSFPANVGGPLCTPLDEYARAIELPKVQPGDLVGVFNAGAYGYSMSMHEFLGHRSPAEVIVDHGNVKELRCRGNFNDLLAGQSW